MNKYLVHVSNALGGYQTTMVVYNSSEERVRIQVKTEYPYLNINKIELIYSGLDISDITKDMCE